MQVADSILSPDGARSRQQRRPSPHWDGFVQSSRGRSLLSPALVQRGPPSPRRQTGALGVHGLPSHETGESVGTQRVWPQLARSPRTHSLMFALHSVPAAHSESTRHARA